jgi:ribosomal protein L12E/L44/L45/RPP1/RPP2
VKNPLEWLADEWVDYFWGELEDNMTDELMKAFGPAIGQAPIPPMPATSAAPPQTPAAELYPPVSTQPNFASELAKSTQSTEQEHAAPVPDPAGRDSVDTAAGVSRDSELTDDSVSRDTAAAGVEVAADPRIETAAVPEVVHDVAPVERVKMAQEQINYLTMLPPMAKNLLGTILTEQHQEFLSNTKNQNPIKAMSFFMTKEGRESVNRLIEMYAQYCKQFD